MEEYLRSLLPYAFVAYEYIRSNAMQIAQIALEMMIVLVLLRVVYQLKNIRWGSRMSREDLEKDAQVNTILSDDITDSIDKLYEKG